jgi:hypothetical protein
LVVLAGVEGEFADAFTVAVDDSDVEVVDEDGDFGAGVGSADTEVPELAGDSEGECVARSPVR